MYIGMFHALPKYARLNTQLLDLRALILLPDSLKEGSSTLGILTGYVILQQCHSAHFLELRISFELNFHLL